MASLEKTLAREEDVFLIAEVEVPIMEEITAPET